ncbi:hypothetical protein [Streptomyces sp. SAJ15]|uniref:hypothetical protein n=1 Tax=Streptomyces sp. SAJ15 TaxID=2011095 RepID=UPI001185074E|nr:hypothetical protein [Streptomyces sp. SAJ15]TVL89762.1 hypothetical protein CD790_25535 [Streptomyces sp. SAJ15]
MRRLAVVLFSTVLLVAATVTPAQAAPQWKLQFADDFSTPVPLGAFSDCNHNVDTPRAYCRGLTGSTRSNWWAYPRQWPDTATQRGFAVGG